MNVNPHVHIQLGIHWKIRHFLNTQPHFKLVLILYKNVIEFYKQNKICFTFRKEERTEKVNAITVS